ncbi:MAG: nucleotidyltransferase domain-containing protein [Oscillospiraceae bacterium]|nr:nucleotidyltransferase domain-containing protein [Oscillospiraceae bacterium]
MKQLYTIDQIQSIVVPIVKEHGASSVSLFGSYAKGTADKHSDIDLKIDKGRLKTLFQIIALRLELEDALKKPVDPVTSDSNDKGFLDTISKEEVLLYREQYETNI